jgi:hypothetical protein
MSSAYFTSAIYEVPQSCHLIKGYDASVCANDCKAEENGEFKKKCIANGGFHKCCVRYYQKQGIIYKKNIQSYRPNVEKERQAAVSPVPPVLFRGDVCYQHQPRKISLSFSAQYYMFASCYECTREGGLLTSVTTIIG